MDVINRVLHTAVGGDFDDTVSLDLEPKDSPGVDDVVVAVEAAPISPESRLMQKGSKHVQREQ